MKWFSLKWWMGNDWRQGVLVSGIMTAGLLLYGIIHLGSLIAGIFYSALLALSIYQTKKKKAF